LNCGEIPVAVIKVEDNNPVGAIQELLRSMLEKGLVSAVLVPQEIPSRKTVVQTLVRDPAKLDSVNPLAPVFGVTSARIVAKMCVDLMTKAPTDGDAVQQQEQAEREEADSPETKEDVPVPEEDQQAETAEEGQDSQQQQMPAEADTQPPAAAEEQSRPAPIALVLRPCEIRALVELAKLQQASLEHFLIVGLDCWGTYSVPDYLEKVAQGSKDSSVTADFLKEVTAGNLPEQLRGACRVCQYPAAACADLAIQFIGEDINNQIRIVAQTEKGKSCSVPLGLKLRRKAASENRLWPS
jgi:coenzyme F420-reducing hydrogenase beta subunit